MGSRSSTERRTCKACGKRKLGPGQNWHRWVGLRACHTCYQRALRGGDFYRHAAIREADRADRAALVRRMRARGESYTSICEAVGIGRATAHELANL